MITDAIGQFVNQSTAGSPNNLAIQANRPETGFYEFGRSLTGGGILIDLIPAIIDGDGRFDLRAVLCEIVVAEQAAVGLRERRQIARDVALVEAVARRLQRRVAAL